MSLSTATHGVPDAQLLEQTKARLRQLTAGLVQLAQSDQTPDQFYPLWLAAVVQALGALESRLWSRDPHTGWCVAWSAPPELCLHNPEEAQDDQPAEVNGSPGRDLLDAVLGGPSRSFSPEEASWTGGCWVLLAAVSAASSATAASSASEAVGQTSSGRFSAGGLSAGGLSAGGLSAGGLSAGERGGRDFVVEVCQRADARGEAIPGQLRFLRQLAEIAGQFQARYRQRQAEEHRLWLVELERFCREVHALADPGLVASCLANTGVALSGAERVSVLVGRGFSAQMAAVTGVEVLDRRSRILRRMRLLLKECARLSLAVAGGEEPEAAGNHRGSPGTWGTRLDQSQTPYSQYLEPFLESQGPIPISLARRGDRYQLEATPRAWVALPLSLPQSPEASQGALLLEWFDAPPPGPSWSGRWAVLCQHASMALRNASARRRSLARLLPGGSLPGGSLVGWSVRWIGLAATLAAIAYALAVVPMEFTLQARGTLQPTKRRQVFARTDGVVAQVTADHSDPVAAGSVLVTLRDDELTDRLKRTRARRIQVQTAIQAIQDQRVVGVQLSPSQRRALASEVETYREEEISLREQEARLARQVAKLQVSSPIDGVVTTWNADQLLRNRPVRRGQVLLTVADPEGPWQLELPFPEDRLGDLLHARAAHGNQLSVTFVLATDSSQSYSGQVRKIARRAELDPDNRNTVTVVVALDRHSLPEELLRPGAGALAKVHCGERPLGLVLFHDLINWFRREVLFRLW